MHSISTAVRTMGIGDDLTVEDVDPTYGRVRTCLFTVLSPIGAASGSNKTCKTCSSFWNMEYDGGSCSGWPLWP